MMSHSNFGRGRGFGPRGTRAISSFGRPRFLRPPFRHVGPPRPGHPVSFPGMPWQPSNMMFQPQLLQHGNPQFRPGGRRRRISSYDVRFPPPNRLPVPSDCEEVVPAASDNPQEDIPATLQTPLLGSEEERQQTIAKTADRLKQKLSCFSSDEMTNIWSDDVALPPAAEDDDCLENRTLAYEQDELNLTHSDLKDIGRISYDNARLDMHDANDVSDVAEDASINVTSDENRSDIDVLSNNQLTNVETFEDQENLLPNNNCIEVERWNSPEPMDNSNNLEQTDIHDTGINAEDQLLQSDVQYDVPPINILQDQCDQPDISQETEVYPTSEKQDISETPNLQDTQLSIAPDEDSQNTTLRMEMESTPDLETQENLVNSPTYANSSTGDNAALSQPALSNMPVLNNVALDNRLPKVTKTSFHSGPPRLSPHVEQELPIDFDPSTPPPLLVKQDQSVSVLPLMHELPLFNPTEPPPNMRVGVKLPLENSMPTWNINTQNQIPPVYNADVHMDLSAPQCMGFMPQQLPLEMPSQSFLAPPIDPMNFSPLFPIPPSNHSVSNTNVPLLPQAQMVPHNVSVASSSPEEFLSFSDCNVDKDDVLNDMQEAMKFAQEMTNISESIAENVSTMEKNDDKSKSDTTSPSENQTSRNPVGNVESISLPPGKPTVKPVKLKRPKRDDALSKKSEEFVPEEQKPSNAIPDAIEIQDDANIKSKDVPIVNEQDRPKVIFNLNNKTIKVKTAWQGDTRGRKREKKNGMTQPVESEIYATPSTRKNLANMPKLIEEERKNVQSVEAKRIQKRVNRMISAETTLTQTAPPRKLQRNIYKEKSQCSNVSIHSKRNPQRPRSHVEKSKKPSLEISWKTNVINRFLKMSRNDIYNMVNNTSLRKFDVLMKRLVKEQKPALSLEMRHVQNEKLKYDQKEFMKQLNAMLDTEATVSITDLPTEFIHHLNEVLQLDMQPDDQVEPTTVFASQSSHSENADYMLEPLTYTVECETMTDIVNEESKSHVTKCDKDIQTNNKINDFNVRDDTSSTIVSNKSSISSKLSALQHDLDNIFSEVTKKTHTPLGLIRKDCIAERRSAKKLDNDASLKNMQKELFLEDDRARNCARWLEKYDKWKKKEREEYTYRNLTKEEWEAKYGTQTSGISSFPAIASSSATASSAAVAPSSAISFSSITSPATAASSTRMVNISNKISSNKPQEEDFYPRRRHSSESMKHSGTRHRSMEKDKHKRSRRHSDDKKHDIEYSDNGNSSNSSSSSSTDSSNSSNSSNTEANVTKLLRVIKENEKVAKKMTLNETIRDEVNAEIERERRQKLKKSRKNRKNAKRKTKRIRHKKRKKSKKISTTSDSSSDKDNSEEQTRLLTESEIKKEIVEDQIQQEVIIKEEVDIGQEENIGEPEFANISSHMESHEHNLASPFAQETFVAADSIIRSYSEDKQLTASPTQPKTKAQLKQMPADMNDNKVPLNIFTTIPESLLACDLSENLRKTREAVDVSCNQNTTDVSLAFNNFTNLLRSDVTDDTVHTLHDKPKESTQTQTDATVHALTDLSTVNIQTETLTSNINSNKSVSGGSTNNTVTQKQGTKKIDIKTYYERTIQRRLNEQAGLKKSTDSSATVSNQDSLIVQKSTESTIVTVSKPISVPAQQYSVQDPQLISAARLVTTSSSTNSKDSVTQTVAEKNMQRKRVKESELAETNLKHPKEDASIWNDSVIKKLDPRNSEAKAKANVNASCITSKSKPAASSKLKKQSETKATITEQKLQRNVSKKFKNIRSEGGKELKLKKEIINTQKKKRAVASKSNLDESVLSTKVCSLKDTKNTEDTKDTENPERKNTEEAADNDACELPSKMPVTSDPNNTAVVEIKDAKEQVAKEVSNSVSKLDVSTPSKIISKPEASHTNEENEQDLLTSSEIQSSNPSNAMNDAELSLNPDDQVELSDDKDLTEASTKAVLVSIAEHDVSSIPESDISRSDNVDTKGKDIQLLINRCAVKNIEINDTNENNVESDILANTCKSASVEEGSSIVGKTVESSSASNENSDEQQGTVGAVISPDSIGSPFKGFLQESIMAFEQSNLFNLELNEIDSDKSKEPAADERPDLMPEENREEHIGKSSDEDDVTAVLRDENHDVDIHKSSESEEQLENDKNYTLNAELAMKESMFIINEEEEIIHDETRPKDLTDKLTTTIDPSLSDAVDTAISDDPLRLSDNQSTEHLNNHVYLETTLSNVEKTSCDKLPDFEPDEHLNDMFYLDDRLQGTSEFDNKDDEPSHFSIHQESPRYDITPTVTPETTTITPDTDLPHTEVEIQKAEQCEFNFKHIPSMDSDCNLLAKRTERSPVRGDAAKTLNASIKVSLKEAATDSFLTSPNNTSTMIEDGIPLLPILDKSPRNDTDLNDQSSSAWHTNVHHDEEIHVVPKTHDETPTQDSININTIQPTIQTNTNDECYDEINVERNKKSTIDAEKHVYNIQRTPVVELQKMTELDNILKKKMQKNSEKHEDAHYKEQKKHKDTILHRIKDKQATKHRSSKNDSNLAKKLKSMKQSRSFSDNTKDAILARMLTIDMEMHKLMMEKLKLHEMLQNHLSIENSDTTNYNSETKTNDKASLQAMSPTLTFLLTQTTETTENRQQNKHTTPKQSSSRHKKRILCSSEDDEIMPYTQRSKTPVIKWKKKPRLEFISKRKENEEKEQEKENSDETTTRQSSKPSPSEKADVDLVDSTKLTQKDEKLDSNAAVTRNDAREQELDAKINEKPGTDTDKSVKHTICSTTSVTEKNVENRSNSRQNSVEREIERADAANVDKRSNVPVSSETVRASSLPRSMQVHSTPEPLSIYSDDSTSDSLVQNIASEMHEKGKSTGLALLDEALKKEVAITKKMKAMARKRKKRQLNTFLKSVDKLTLEEEELPLSKLYIRKLRQKRDLLDLLSQKKKDLDIIVDPNIQKNMDEVINAVAENRVDDLYEQQLEAARIRNDVPTTSNIPAVSKSDKHHFYIDVEANANSDWASQEKENIEQIVLQQNSNDISAVDVSNHVFKAVSQSKVSFNEHNVEPNSSVTPEETLMAANHSTECGQVNSKDVTNTALRNFDIKVSVPKTLIKDNFSLELLQRFKDTEVNSAGRPGMVDSTTNAFSTNTEKPEDRDKNSRCDLRAAKPLLKDERDENQKEDATKLIEKDKTATGASDDKQQNSQYELQKEEATKTVDNVEIVQSETAKSGYSDITESEEDSGDNVRSIQYDKITDAAHDSNASTSIIEKGDTKEERSNTESERSSDAKQNYQNEENTAVTDEDEKHNAKSKSQHISEESLDNDRSTGNITPVDRMSEKSEESEEMCIVHKSDLERTSVAILSFNEVIEKDAEASKKLRRKSGRSTPVRRSTRYNDNIKSSKINDTNANSNSNEQESSSHESDSIIRHSSKSPIGMHDEKSANNIRKNRATQKEQPTSTRKMLESEIKLEHPSCHVLAESSKDTTARKRKYTMWQMMNCKVRLVDCKHTLLTSNVRPEALSSLGIVVVNPYVPSHDISHIHVAHDTAITPAAISKRSSTSPDRACDKDKTEIEILEEKPMKKSNDHSIEESTSLVANADDQEPVRMQYTTHKGPILDIKVFGNSFLAASEDGKIYRYSQTSNGILNIYKGHKSAVTCLYIYNANVNKELLYSGSLDGTLRCYNIKTGALVKSPAYVNSPIQCMDQAWGMIFAGTKSGHVSRFYIKGSTIKGSNIQFSDNSVLALKATNEGPRKILIVASRSQPITIRDATTGLFLRTISSQKTHTVYSLMRHHNLIYCGTSSTSINVFDFTTGEQTIQYEAGVGIVCMRLYEQLLFAGCYDGNIYVFDTTNRKLVCSIRGPGNMLLSLEVVNNKIIAGTKDKRLHSWQMPNQVRALFQKIS